MTTDAQVTADGLVADVPLVWEARGPARAALEGDDIPEGWRATAERVRRHLVALRGGAPFLSPDDAALLLQWLSDGVPLHRILPAIEAAADRRRARRHRVPLALVHAAPELRKAAGGGGGRTRRSAASPERPPGDAAGTDPAAMVRVNLDALGGPLREPAAAAARGLDGPLPDDADARLDAVLEVVTAFFEAAWPALGTEGQATWLAAAEAALHDVLPLVDDAEREALLEEHARGLLRASFPALSATSLVQRCLAAGPVG